MSLNPCIVDWKLTFPTQSGKTRVYNFTKSNVKLQNRKNPTNEATL